MEMLKKLVRCSTLAALTVLAGCATVREPAPQLPLVHTEGTRWLDSNQQQVTLRGVNLGNWLLNEFWMMEQGSAGIDDQCKLEGVLDKRFGHAERERLMKLFRDNWITTRDWDLIRQHGLNVVRLPFIYSVVEDEYKPRTLRPDAWHYLDWAIEQAESRGIYVILDLHGAVGSQGTEHHSGCANKNEYWSNPEYQARTEWLWQQVANRYKDRTSVAGYSILNEPWGTTPENMAAVMRKLYAAVRAADPNHVIILPGHVKGIDAYGKPSDYGMRNVAFEMHPYPGHFGWDKPGIEVHRKWLTCDKSGGDTVCAWDERLKKLDTAFYVGEIQPYAFLGLERGGQVARASFDTYAKYGWAATAWSWKIVTRNGGHGEGIWGMITNAKGATVPETDFNTASLAEIEALFRSFGTQPYEIHEPLQRWLTSTSPRNINDIQ